MKITMLPSDKGDCLFLESPDGTTILVDGGLPGSYSEHVRPFLGKWHAANRRRRKPRPIDLVYVSHIDQDHIGGVLQLMNDVVAWRVYRARGAGGKKPKFAEPPEIKGIWHNAFHDLVEDNAGEIGSMLAARAAVLTNATHVEAPRLAAYYQNIAASIPEAIKLSSRISPDQLNIPLNKEFDGMLAMVREEEEEDKKKKGFPLNGKRSSPLVTVLGPFEDDVKKFRDKWNDWLEDKKNKANLHKTREWVDREAGRFAAAGILLSLDAKELGDRTKVTEENLASLMLHIEQGGKTILLTGDGHCTDIIRGLTHSEIIKKDDDSLHVNVLKVPHHGSEHNLTADFARQVTADHYIICGNGRHDNPDIDVLKRIFEGGRAAMESREGRKSKRHFHVWFNCGVKFLERDIDRRKRERRGVKDYEKALKHFKEIEGLAAGHVKKGGVTVHYLNSRPLVLDLASG